MRFLFLDSSFSPQLLHLPRFLGVNGHEVVWLTQSQTPLELPGVRRIVYKQERNPSPKTHDYLHGLERAVFEGQSAYRVVAELKKQGFRPDVIIGHAGGGASLYMKDLFPEVPLLCYFAWYFKAYGSDVAFTPQDRVEPDEECRIRTRNGPILLDLYSCDAGLCPTWWQHSQLPVEYARKISVIHDGINTEAYCPLPGKKMVLPQLGLDLSQAPEIVTYVNSGMESYHGFPQFMEAILELQRRRPHCHVVLVGGKKALAELPLDMSRIHFTGELNRADLLTVLQASTVHVYLTRPFILSGSMLEAMSCGCALVASATPPVQEVVVDRVNGLLADFNSPRHIADQVYEALSDSSLRQGLAHRARATILERYDLRLQLPRQLNLLGQLIESAKGAGQ